MLTRKDLFAKALLVEKPWFVHEIKSGQNTGKPSAVAGTLMRTFGLFRAIPTYIVKPD